MKIEIIVRKTERNDTEAYTIDIYTQDKKGILDILIATIRCSSYTNCGTFIYCATNNTHQTIELNANTELREMF